MAINYIPLENIPDSELDKIYYSRYITSMLATREGKTYERVNDQHSDYHHLFGQMGGLSFPAGISDSDWELTYPPLGIGMTNISLRQKWLHAVSLTLDIKAENTFEIDQGDFFGDGFSPAHYLPNGYSAFTDTRGGNLFLRCIQSFTGIQSPNGSYEDYDFNVAGEISLVSRSPFYSKQNSIKHAIYDEMDHPNGGGPYKMSEFYGFSHVDLSPNTTMEGGPQTTSANVVNTIITNVDQAINVYQAVTSDFYANQTSAEATFKTNGIQMIGGGFVTDHLESVVITSDRGDNGLTSLGHQIHLGYGVEDFNETSTVAIIDEIEDFGG